MSSSDSAAAPNSADDAAASNSAPGAVPRRDDEPIFHRLWPTPGPLSAEGLLGAYAVPVGRPLLRVNFVSSVDGAVTVEGRSGGLGGPGDRTILSLLRVPCDAVLVGAGTVRVEGYSPLRTSALRRQQRIAQGRAPEPVLALVTRRLDFDPADPRFTQAPQRPIVVTTEESARRVGDRFAAVADVIGVGSGEIDLARALTTLAERGLPHVLCEGGPHLLGALIEADLVDEFCLTLAPKLAGPGAGRIVAGLPTPIRTLVLNQVLAAGDELFLHYRRP
jgi:riboflavin biosynthesis pyrimidine reductase